MSKEEIINMITKQQEIIKNINNHKDIIIERFLLSPQTIEYIQIFDFEIDQIKKQYNVAMNKINQLCKRLCN